MLKLGMLACLAWQDKALNGAGGKRLATFHSVAIYPV